uniref:Uncharacterized protein n=1 Tax=Anopheles arabiensis TaxID=7173 RepID=A0A182IFE7_ANOAR
MRKSQLSSPLKLSQTSGKSHHAQLITQKPLKISTILYHTLHNVTVTGVTAHTCHSAFRLTLAYKVDQFSTSTMQHTCPTIIAHPIYLGAASQKKHRAHTTRHCWPSDKSCKRTLLTHGRTQATGSDPHKHAAHEEIKQTDSPRSARSARYSPLVLAGWSGVVVAHTRSREIL